MLPAFTSVLENVPITELAATFSLTLVALNAKSVGAWLRSAMVRTAVGCCVPTSVPLLGFTRLRLIVSLFSITLSPAMGICTSL